MIPDNCIQYVRKCLRSGYSRKMIEFRLHQSEYTEDEIAEVFNYCEAIKERQGLCRATDSKISWKRRILALACVLMLIAGTAIFFFHKEALADEGPRLYLSNTESCLGLSDEELIDCVYAQKMAVPNTAVCAKLTDSDEMREICDSLIIGDKSLCANTGSKEGWCELIHATISRNVSICNSLAYEADQRTCAQKIMEEEYYFLIFSPSGTGSNIGLLFEW
jgi:hypothetical protein